MSSFECFLCSSQALDHKVFKDVRYIDEPHLFASRAQLRIHQRETGCYRSIIEKALAASNQAFVDRHEGSTEPVVEQDNIPGFEGVSPAVSVGLNDPMDTEDDDDVADAQVEDELIDNEVTEEEDLVERGPIVQQRVDDAQVEDCDELAMKLMR
ncbi:hypothetical protein EDC96DRAFT_550516, partial [Choanephora cucurbitarum]